MDSKTKKKSVFAVGEIFNTFSSENDDNAFKMAMFNGIAVLIVVLFAVTASGIYFILQPFLKPLLWALISGSVLHPIKKILAVKLRTEVTKLESDSKPFYLTVVCIPFSIVFKTADSLGNFIISYRSLLLKAIGFLCSLLLVYLYIPNFLFRLNSIFMGLNKYVLMLILNIFGSTYVVRTYT